MFRIVLLSIAPVLGQEGLELLKLSYVTCSEVRRAGRAAGRFLWTGAWSVLSVVDIPVARVTAGLVPIVVCGLGLPARSGAAAAATATAISCRAALSAIAGGRRVLFNQNIQKFGICGDLPKLFQ